MGLLDIFKSKPSNRFESLFGDIVDEANHKKKDEWSDAPYHQLERVKAIMQLTPEDQAAFLVFLLEKARTDPPRTNVISYRDPWYHALKIADYALKNVTLEVPALEKIGSHLKRLRGEKINDYYVPSLTFLTAMQKSIRHHGHTKSSKSLLESLRYPSENFLSGDQLKENDLILYLLQDDDAALEIAEHDQWGPVVIAYLKQADGDIRKAWLALFAHCKSGAGKSSPTAKWMKEASPLLEKIGNDTYAKQLSVWLQHLQLMLQHVHKQTQNNFLRNENHELLKGLIWCAGIINNSDLNEMLEDYAVWAYKKKPGVGSISVKTGTAAMFAFSQLPVKDGVARLSKFRTKIKNNSILKAINKILRTTSEKNNLSISAMEELAVPDFGISESLICLTLENCIGQYSFAEGEITWRRGDKSQKSIPADVKDKFASEIKAFRKTIKEAEEMLPVVKARLEQSYLDQREWDFLSWQKLYIDHAFTSLVAKKLIWHFSRGEQKTQAIFSAGGFIDVNEQPVLWLDASTRVQVWHPIGFSSEQILNWRNFIRRHKLVQPFKQAYREVYIITDAELRTDVYSNRYAAHILRQHQFAALLRQRGWHYTLQGNWDSHNTPYLKLPQWSLVAEFLVNAEWQGEGAVNDMGIFNYITTDQVRFIRGNESLPLRDVPAIVFSEVMRDVDLFVGVTSIGNDVAWQDGGDRLQDIYWREYSFSDLSESAKIRRQVLESLVPSLKIASVCSFDKKYLIVKGKLKTYKIHMGSGNILMEPDDRYLCIVPESKNVSKAGEKVFLPFEGDGLLSIIISKAFLLAADDKIKDPTITRQLN